MSAVDRHVRDIIKMHMREIGKILKGDTLTIFSPITFGLDIEVKYNIEAQEDKSNKLIVVLDTYGGIIDIVERIVNTIRNFYDEVDMIIPDRAMSAGTIFALSADNIWMNYFSYLGPIDPQVHVEDKLRPALGYLEQFKRLTGKSAHGQLTEAEAILLSKLDLADLYRYEQAREHSVELLEDWLSTYKFKGWKKTETRGLSVTDEMRRFRAKEIAETLNNTERWHTHGRGIGMQMLKDELKLKVENFDENDPLSSQIKLLYDLVIDYTVKSQTDMFVEMSGER